MILKHKVHLKKMIMRSYNGFVIWNILLILSCKDTNEYTAVSTAGYSTVGLVCTLITNFCIYVGYIANFTCLLQTKDSFKSNFKVNLFCGIKNSWRFGIVSKSPQNQKHMDRSNLWFLMRKKSIATSLPDRPQVCPGNMFICGHH